ncbi:MAG TPA: DUF5916 domain-containing protein [Gemmatimonadales bacterium]|nr:DUF5916 domain-containing protein [Gemmatimonadales bacterium]
MLGLLTLFLVPQGPQMPERFGTRPDPVPPAVAAPTANTAVAVRAVRPPVIDGKDDDAIWRLTPAITQFHEFQPTEGKAARFPTEVRVAYDAANLYVFVRAFDPHPDSIIRLLDRRDSWLPTDHIGVMIDSYHDRRNGYEFWVNPAGVKVDQAIYDDNEDGAWDAVWDVATRIDSLGWTAEFRIPLSQLRYAATREHTFGVLVIRDIYRFNERTAWPQVSQARAGLTVQFGEVSGFDDLEPPRRLEAAPYAVARNQSDGPAAGFTRSSHAAFGADLKYRVASNVTLDATVNPDFGQVEADPSVLNLTNYETFYDERRPFFVAGRGLFRFDVNCSMVNCNSEGLYYSRRIGRTPELAGLYGAGAPQPTTIFGAGKLTGRLPGGFAFGVVDAVTGRATGGADSTGATATTEPATNYAVLRVKRDSPNGATSVGGMLTAVNRNLDAFTSPWLARDAYVGAVDFRHRFLHDTYQISGSVDVSRVAGSPAAILQLQTDPVHYYQRADARLPLDSTRTVLAGDAEEIKLGKVAGQHLQGETSYLRRSAGFEINDLGYLQRADQQSWATWLGYTDRTVRKLYQQFQWNFNWWQNWTTAGLAQERAFNTNAHMILRNSWGLNAGGTVGQLGAVYDDRTARGGPAVRVSPYLAPWVYVSGDDRKAFMPALAINYTTGDGGHSHTVRYAPAVTVKVASRFNAWAELAWSRNHNDIQWLGLLADSSGASQYTFAHLAQSTTVLTLRLGYTFTATTSLQVYAQPFISKGTFSNVRQLSATPRAAAYDDRYAPYTGPGLATTPMGFNYKAFQSTAVFRWEYRPGSTLFLVWSQGRQGWAGEQGTADAIGDVRDLFRIHPMNTFLVKMSYWLNT